MYNNSMPMLDEAILQIRTLFRLPRIIGASLFAITPLPVDTK
jgi:hypothetical protein